jgi:hypothetical protein
MAKVTEQIMSKASKSAQDNRANQLNPTHPAYHQSRGASSSAAEQRAEQQKPPPEDASSEASVAPSKPSSVKPE